VVAGGAASGLQAVAQDPRDGSIEALVAPDHLLLAVLWHPERDRGAAQEALVRRALQGEGAAKCAA
jgi:gamma-glutamyl-gamma-aminobutyrate hydrolase PuuD